MKIIITNIKNEISKKTGKPYTVISGIDKDGKTFSGVYSLV